LRCDVALSVDDVRYFDGKFGETHKRISDVREDVARLESRACPDVKEHIGVYHRRNGDGNGNGNRLGSYPAVPDTFRSTSWSATLKLFLLIVGVITATFGLLKGFGL
jgi:hypothetical protein